MRSQVRVLLSPPKRRPPIGWSFLFGWKSDTGRETIWMRQSGGLSLAAGSTAATLWLNRVLLSPPKRRPPIGWSFLFGWKSDTGWEPIWMRQSGGLSLAAGSTAATLWLNRVLLSALTVSEIFDDFFQQPLCEWPPPFRNDHSFKLHTFFTQFLFPRERISPLGIICFVQFVPAVQAKFRHIDHHTLQKRYSILKVSIPLTL